MANILPFPKEVGRRKPNLGGAATEIRRPAQSSIGEIIKFPDADNSAFSNGNGIEQSSPDTRVKSAYQETPDQGRK